MSEEATRTGGVFLPYPLLGIIMGLMIALAGGITGLYTQISAMNTTMILRDNSYQQQVKELKDKADLQSVYIQDLREKVIKLEANRKGG